MAFDYHKPMKSKLRCVVCQGFLTGRQRNFCSRVCKNKHTNHRHQSYVSQQVRGLERKMRLVAMAGGGCLRCGYSKNLAALAWHHLDPSIKSFSLDLRALSNHAEDEIQMEVAKCILLCANCHAEEHFPTLSIEIKDSGLRRYTGGRFSKIVTKTGLRLKSRTE